MTPAEHAEFMKCHAYILRALRDEMEYRRINSDDWEERERFAVALAANEWAVTHGLHAVTVDEIEDIEHLAMGHVDYASKLALYVTEMVYGVRKSTLTRLRTRSNLPAMSPSPLNPSNAYTVRWDEDLGQFALLLYGEPIDHFDEKDDAEGLAYEYNRGLA